MSHFTTPLIVVNLGCEMLYVIEQRLRAQEISTEKSERVLTDLTSVLLHPKLLDELFIPQPVATHSVIKQLLQDISATSIMKLDDYSMNKLWDLMTMIFKWQLSTATTQTIFDITRRHLKSVATLLPQNYPKVIIEIAMRKFEDLAQKFTDADYNSLRSTMILWFSEYHVKISVLLRLGLQKKDGTFSLPATIPTKISENMGENIYKYDNKRNPVEDYENKCSDTHEISCLLAAIESVSSDHKLVALQLPVEFSNTESTKKTLEIQTNTPFEDIKTNVKKIKNADLSFNSTVPKSAQEDLLDLIDTTESN